MSILTQATISSMTHVSQTARGNLQSSIGRISHGSRIASASDDAAGLSIATRLHAHQVSVQEGIHNANLGISLLQTAEGSLSEVNNNLTRMRELAVQSSTDTLTDDDRSLIDFEYQHLFKEINRITTLSNFNQISLLQNNDTDFQIQVGYLNDASHRISIDLSKIKTSTTDLGIASIGSIGTKDEALNTFNTLDSAMNSVNNRRSYLGSFTNRLDNALADAQSLATNMVASESRIIDLDFAKESSEMTRFRILHQTSIAALGQARSIHLTNLNGIFSQM
jgi:flagellin